MELPLAVRKSSPLRIALIAAVIFLAFGILWWRSVYSNPQRVFDAMLNNSWRLESVSRRVRQSNNGQVLDQATYTDVAAGKVAASRTALSQGGEQGTIVTTETIGVPTDDYVRYTGIDTPQTNQQGRRLDFSSILNIWGHNAADIGNSLTDGELFNESVLGIVPFGKLSRAQRQELLKLAKEQNVYEVDFAAVERSSENGRPQYTFAVSVGPESYVLLLKRFGQMTGLNQLEALDPAIYAGAARLELMLTVDVWSRQLTKIQYAGGERVEELSGHNARKHIALPENAIGVDELQQKLQDLQ